MVGRRTFLFLTAGGLAAPLQASAQQAPRKVALYANVGADMTHYDVDVENAALIRRDTVTLPAGVQYAWPHASQPFLYVVSSTGGASSLGVTGTDHFLSALPTAAQSPRHNSH